MTQKNATFNENTLEAVKDNLEERLGVGGAELVFKTLKLVYKIDEEDIIRHPELLGKKLEKLLGSSTTQLVLADT
jgi:hypothetical protein